MARQVCIKVGTTMVCMSSPLRDCSCDRNDKYPDPFRDVPATRDPDEVLNDIREVIATSLKPGGIDIGEQDAKAYALMACARLLYAPGVNVVSPFLIMAMEDAPTRAS